MSVHFGPVRQVGYVVADIDAAMARWIALGVGPWFCKDDVPSTEYRYFGRDGRAPRLSIALANSGDLQLELIQQRDAAPSLYRDSLATAGEGAQHVAYWTMDRFDAFGERLVALGYVEGQGGRMGPKRGRYAYFVRADAPGLMIEVSESTGGKAEYFETVRAASIGWDGRDPVRRIGPTTA